MTGPPTVSLPRPPRSRDRSAAANRVDPANPRPFTSIDESRPRNRPPDAGKHAPAVPLRRCGRPALCKRDRGGCPHGPGGGRSAGGRRNLPRLPRRRGPQQTAAERRRLVAHRGRGHVRAVGARADRLRRLPCRGQASCPSGQCNGLRQRTRACAGAKRQLPRLPRPGVQGLRRQQPRDAAACRQPRGARLRRLPPTARGHAGIGAGRADERLHRMPRRHHRTARAVAAQPGQPPRSVACSACHAPDALRRVDLRILVGANPLQDRDGTLQFERRARAADVNHDGLDANELRGLLADLEGGGEALSLRGRIELRSGIEAHELPGKARALRECTGCHDQSALPFQHVTVSILDADGRPLRYDAHRGVLSSAITWEALRGFYAIGGTRLGQLDVLLALGLAGGIAVPALHLAARRWFGRRRHRQPDGADT